MLGDDDGDPFGLEGQASEAERLGPRVDIPSVEDPSESLPDPSTVDPEIQRSFAVAVIYANVAVLGVSLGLMLIGFRGQWRWGGFAVAVGLLAGVRVYQTVRAFRTRDRDDDESGSDVPETEPEPETAVTSDGDG
ncbi:hypothetical protein BRC97_04525 [Halobacteriales archaeon QS_6_71_20]|nr:MAG: hypothetical protein BRC97_04525 [Halobacteriales archaeon QS_6_71_20]